MTEEHAAPSDEHPVSTDSTLAALAPQVLETHTAYVFFVGDRVYKLKKAVDLGFLDHRTREARRQACEDEVRLNRRFASDVYLDVLDINGSDGQVQDHLVAMRRMPDHLRLSRCVERGDDLDDALRHIAHLVAGVHGASSPEPDHDRNANVDAVRGRWVDGFDQLGPLAGQIPGAKRLERCERLVLRYLAGRGPLFVDRITRGKIRDGHGDLQAGDIFVLPDGPRILDCIEFGEDYRWGDVLADVAFLAMDLHRLGRPDLADQFLRWHGELSGDRWPASLASHYIAYRAHIRAKVTILRHLQRGEPVGQHASDLLDLSLRHLETGQVRLIVVGGLPGTGKSTLAAGIADRLGAVVLRTDEVRQRIDSDGPRYGSEAVTATYRQLLSEAERLLRLGESVVLDATWNDATLRSEARAVAAATSSLLDELQCTLPHELAAERIRQRMLHGDDPSEATPAVAEAMAERFEPWPGATDVSTEPDPASVLSTAFAGLARG